MKTVIDAVNELKGDLNNDPDYQSESDVCIGVVTKKLDCGDEAGTIVTLGPDFKKNKISYICTVEEFNQCVAEMSEAKWIPESKPVFTQAMADAGELPPVGCDYLDEDGQLCLCIGHSIEKGFVVGQMVEHPSSNGYPPISTSEKTCVKPIKTEREKAIDEMLMTAIESKDDIAKSIIYGACVKLHNAGYRKPTSPQAKAYDDKTEYFGEDYK